jgi:SOS-response transcriptional repressor LexA
MIGLTAKQRELYQFIAATIAESGIAPTFAEMARALGLQSKGRIHVLIGNLESKGAIRRFPRQTRAIELVPQGDAIELRPEVRAAALEFARRTHTSLSTVIAEAVEAYVGAGGP